MRGIIIVIIIIELMLSSDFIVNRFLLKNTKYLLAVENFCRVYHYNSFISHLRVSSVTVYVSHLSFRDDYLKTFKDVGNHLKIIKGTGDTTGSSLKPHFIRKSWLLDCLQSTIS